MKWYVFAPALPVLARLFVALCSVCILDMNVGQRACMSGGIQMLVFILLLYSVVTVLVCCGERVNNVAVIYVCSGCGMWWDVF